MFLAFPSSQGPLGGEVIFRVYANVVIRLSGTLPSLFVFTALNELHVWSLPSVQGCGIMARTASAMSPNY